MIDRILFSLSGFLPFSLAIKTLYWLKDLNSRAQLVSYADVHYALRNKQPSPICNTHIHNTHTHTHMHTNTHTGTHKQTYCSHIFLQIVWFFSKCACLNMYVCDCVEYEMYAVSSYTHTSYTIHMHTSYIMHTHIQTTHLEKKKTSYLQEDILYTQSHHQVALVPL